VIRMNLPILSSIHKKQIHVKMIPKVRVVQRQDFLSEDFVREFHSNLVPDDSVLEIELVNQKLEGYQNVDPESLVHLSIILDSVFWESYLSDVLSGGTIVGLTLLLNQIKSHISGKKYRYLKSNGPQEAKINLALKVINKDQTIEYALSDNTDLTTEHLETILKHIEKRSKDANRKTKKTDKKGKGKSKK